MTMLEQRAVMGGKYIRARLLLLIVSMLLAGCGGGSGSGSPSSPPPQSDTQAPSVALPYAQVTPVTNTASFTANVSDNVGVTQVQWLLNGAPSGPPDASAPYTLTIAAPDFVNGSYSLSAVATDMAGNSATSAAITLNIANPPAPLFSTTKSDVTRFDMASNGESRLGFVSCDLACTTLEFSELDASGASITPPTAVKQGWDRSVGVLSMYGTWRSDFRVAYDMAARPHVLWGEGGSVYHSVRNGGAAWTSGLFTPAASFGLGRVLAPAMNAAGEIVAVTTRDYKVDGGYVFSIPAMIEGAPGSASVADTRSVGEYIWDLDLAFLPSGPMLAVAQRQYGGWEAFALLYRPPGAGWEGQALASAWGSCLRPVRLAQGAPDLHVMSCGKAYAVGGDPAVSGGSLSLSQGAVASFSPLGTDMVWEAGELFAVINQDGSIRLGSMRDGRWRSIVLASDGCTSCDGRPVKIAVLGEVLVVARLTAGGDVKIQGFSRAAVQALLELL